MKTTFKTLLLHISAIVLFSLPVALMAAGCDGGKDFGLCNPIGVDSISGLIRIIVKVIRYIAIPFVVIMIMYAGWLYLWSGATGNSGGIGKAHEALKWIVIGSFVILSAELIAIVVENTIKTLSR